MTTQRQLAGDPDPLWFEPHAFEFAGSGGRCGVCSRLRPDAIHWPGLRGDPGQYRRDHPEAFLEPAARPVPRWFAWFGLGVCVGVILFALLITAGNAIAAPRSADVIPAAVSDGVLLGGVSPAASGNLRLTGAPLDPALVPAAVSGDVRTAGAPQPTQVIAPAVWQASATWCAPTPTKCQGWGGDVRLAALPTYDGTPYRIRVTYGEHHVDALVVSVCDCGVDLSPAAFRHLAPLSRGRIAVQVEGPIAVVLPPTDQ